MKPVSTKTLCLDAGNTRLKWGLWESAQAIHAPRSTGGRWLAQGAVAHQQLDNLAGDLTAALPARPDCLLACNVAGPHSAAQIEAVAARLGVPLHRFSSSAFACGVSNGYAQPAQLGADRWAALIAARSRHTGPALVVMAGTATTIDTLDASGRFCGGLILPGLAMMTRALAKNTAALPDAHGRFVALPTNTDDAIASGVLQATLGAIERMARPLCPPCHLCRPASADFCVLLSGGAAGQLAPHLDGPLQQIDNLVLEGLVCFAAEALW